MNITLIDVDNEIRMLTSKIIRQYINVEVHTSSVYTIHGNVGVSIGVEKYQIASNNNDDVIPNLPTVINSITRDMHLANLSTHYNYNAYIKKNVFGTSTNEQLIVEIEANDNLLKEVLK